MRARDDGSDYDEPADETAGREPLLDKKGLSRVIGDRTESTIGWLCWAIKKYRLASDRVREGAYDFYIKYLARKAMRDGLPNAKGEIVRRVSVKVWRENGRPCAPPTGPADPDIRYASVRAYKDEAHLSDRERVQNFCEWDGRSD